MLETLIVAIAAKASNTNRRRHFECRGSVAECLMDEEFQMGTERNMRILQTRRYISYGALRRNMVPCSRRGDVPPYGLFDCHLEKKHKQLAAAALSNYHGAVQKLRNKVKVSAGFFIYIDWMDKMVTPNLIVSAMKAEGNI
ncbi:hypothetical protein NC653_024411 [Populus alba x Populus x berolinensis]|uniref:Uncharacterized protein n=1 Tax=Populus alba x Populus x berolinensis TaxID=444605 RepID=A0AAD6M8Q3_9ROSI|nr:hypothetical protein NC653_024411 [Populus alba x Populus x berolinensis]